MKQGLPNMSRTQGLPNTFTTHESFLIVQFVTHASALFEDNQ